MPGQGEFTANVVLDTSQAQRQAVEFAQRFPVIKPKIDGSGLGFISRQAGEFERALGSAQARVASFTIAAGAVYSVARAFKELVVATVEVNKQLTDLNVVLGLSQSGLSKFSANLFQVANLTGQSFKDVAAVALDFSRQGLNATETLKRTADAMTLVRISGTELTTAVGAITATLNTFNEVGLDSTAILNKIATVDLSFAVSGKVIAEALTRSASSAQEAGVSFDKLIGITTALSQITARSGSVIGNSLKSIFLRIERPQVIEQLNQMAIATEDLNGQLLSADKILTNLAKSYDGLTQAQQSQITTLAAGLFQANQFKAIISDLAKENGIAARASKVSADATEGIARRQAELNTSLAAQLQVSLNNLTQFASKAGSISIAPALKNVFKLTDFVTTGGNDDVGKNIGEGLLKGLGNYLSGPGLALGGVLIGKFFLQFSTYAAKSLATIIETNSARYQQEQAIDNLLKQQPGLLQEILALGNQEVKIQELLLQKFAAQNGLLNERAAVTNKLLALSVPPGVNLGAKSERLLQINEDKIGLNPSFKRAGTVPAFNSVSDSLSEAINREKAMGVSPSSIKVGTSPLLSSPDNPYGLGVYNTKDEPLGLNQGIQRVAGKGIDPKKAGQIPNFADIPYPFNLLPERLRPEKYREQTSSSFDVRNLVPDKVRYGTPPPLQTFPLLLGQGTGKNAIQLPELSDSTKKLNAEIAQSIQYFKELNANLPKLLTRGPVRLGDKGGNSLIGPDRQTFEVGKYFENLTPKTKLLGPGAIRLSDLGGNGPFGPDKADFLRQQALVNPITRNNIPRFSTDLSILEGFSGYQLELQKAKINNEKAINNLGLRQLATSFLPNSEYARIQKTSTALGQEGQFSAAKKDLANKALISSFILPLAAGVAQQGIQDIFGNNSLGARGAAATVGGLGNVASYAAIGGTVGGPYGVAAGAGLGLALELPKIIKSFTDTLPDLENKLNTLKDTTTQTSDAFSGYISAQEKLTEIRNGETKATIGQYNKLFQTQSESFNKLPQEAQGEIRSAIKAGKIGDVYNIASKYNSINQQNINAIQDIISLKSLPQSKFSTAIEYGNTTSKEDQDAFFKNINLANSIASSPGRLNQQADLSKLVSINPLLKSFANSILDFQNKEGLTLDEILQKTKPAELSKVNPNNLGEFLSKQGFSSDTIGNIGQIISEIKTKPKGEEYLTKLISPESIKERFTNIQEYISGFNKETKQFDELNSKLANLTVTGTAAINNFEINVINRLSQSLTKLKLQSISEDTAAKISQIRSGNNPYNQEYFNYIKQNSSARNQFNEETVKANSNFTNKIGNDFYDVINNFTKGLQGTGKNAATDLSTLVENKRIELNKVLEGFFQTDADFTVKTLKSNYSSKDVSEISNNLNNKIKELENESNTIVKSLIPDAATLLKSQPGAKNVLEAIYKSGNSPATIDLSNAINKLPTQSASKILALTPDNIDEANTARQNIDEIIKSYQSLLAKLTQDSADLNKNLAEAKNNLNSNLQVSYKQLTDNLSILSEQFKSQQSNNLFSTNLGLSINSTNFGLARQAKISNPIQAIQLAAEANNNQSLNSILSNLNSQTKLGITNPNQINSYINQQKNALNSQQNFIGPLSQSQLQSQTAIKGNIESLINAQDEWNKVLRESDQNVQQLIKSLSPFSDVNARSKREQNTSILEQGGNLTGKNYTNAFLSPFAYNNKDFQRDSSNALQDFAYTIKDDLGSALSQVTAGAKNASEAFTDLGLSLAKSLANKGIDIGLNSLFGLGLQGLQSVAPSLKSVTAKSAGGYIPKFASGGFVNMGSGMRDDVPALLSGGEFVINKNAVNRIGKNNLDLMNDTPHFADGGVFRQPKVYINRPKNPSSFPGVTSDTINGGATNADINLANSFLINKNSKNGSFDTSSLLSAIGQTNDLNPQNRIKFAREKWLYGRRQAYKQYQKQLDAYNFQQYLGLGQAYLGAVGSIASAFATPQTQQSAQLTQFNAGAGPISESAANANVEALSTYGGFGSTNIFRSSGGYIPKFANGGYFGGDSSGDNFKAMVMGGEYVMSPKTVSRYGADYFKGLNNTSQYANGGYVSDGISSSSNTEVLNVLSEIRDGIKGKTGNNNENPQRNTQQTNHVTINVSMDNKGNTTDNGQSSTSKSNNNDTGTQNNNKEAWDKTTALIKNHIISTLTKESRDGGLLAQTFKKK